MLTLSLCSDYVHHELERGFQGAVYSDMAEFGRFTTALAGELEWGELPLSILGPPVRVPGVDSSTGRVGSGCRVGDEAGDSCSVTPGLNILPLARSGKQQSFQAAGIGWIDPSWVPRLGYSHCCTSQA